MQTSVNVEGRIHRTRPSRSTSVEKMEKDKKDLPIHTGYFHTGESNTLIFIVNGTNAVSSFVHALNNRSEHGRAA